MTALYVVLGAGPSDRAALTAHLIEHGLEPGEGPFTVYATARDLGGSERARADLEAHARTTVVTVPEGTFTGGGVLPRVPESGTVFFLSDGSGDPVDQIETLRAWMDANDLKLARIFTVVDCALLAANPGATPWYDACIHFSDVVLLGNRADVSKKWVRGLEERLRREALPCHTAYLKAGGKVDAPAELLYPEARRISQFFDPVEEDAALVGLEIEGDEPEEEEEGEADPRNDPFLARTEQGHRIRNLVDITRFTHPQP